MFEEIYTHICQCMYAHMYISIKCLCVCRGPKILVSVKLMTLEHKYYYLTKCHWGILSSTLISNLNFVNFVELIVIFSLKNICFQKFPSWHRGNESD